MGWELSVHPFLNVFFSFLTFFPFFQIIGLVTEKKIISVYKIVNAKIHSQKKSYFYNPKLCSSFKGLISHKEIRSNLSFPLSLFFFSFLSNFSLLNLLLLFSLFTLSLRELVELIGVLYVLGHRCFNSIIILCFRLFLFMKIYFIILVSHSYSHLNPECDSHQEIQGLNRI